MKNKVIYIPNQKCGGYFDKDTPDFESANKLRKTEFKMRVKLSNRK